MHIFVTGCNHRTAPLAIREQLAFDPPAAQQAMREFRVAFPDAETLVLSTCNRIEFYVAGPALRPPSERHVHEFLARWHNVEPAELERVSYVHHGRAAIEHLMAVAASLDSMVIGETQILGQVREAMDIAQRGGVIGPVLSRLCQDAISSARRVHSETELTAGRVSVASVAIQFAQQIFADLRGKTVLLLGAGKMARQLADRLAELAPAGFIAANRSVQRAEELAERFGGRAIDLDGLAETLCQADVVVASTGAGEPVITAEMVRSAMKARRYRPMFMIDIAVPRDIEPESAAVRNVYLYNIDDLQRVVESAISGRSQHLERARMLLAQSADQFVAWLCARAIGPTIEAFAQRLADLRAEQLDWLMPKLEQVSQRDRELIEQFAHRLVSKLMHDPVKELTESCRPDSAGGDVYAQVLAQLFRLDVESRPGP